MVKPIKVIVLVEKLYKPRERKSCGDTEINTKAKSGNIYIFWRLTRASSLSLSLFIHC